MKQGYIILAVILVISLLLVGCSSSKTTTTAPGSTTAATTTTSVLTASTTSSTATSVKTSTSISVATKPKYGGILKVIYDSGPSGSIGYPQELSGDATTAPQLCFEPLLKENNKGEFSPWLAESYKLADDQSWITFNIRKGIKFHDGSDLNATAVKWNLENTIAAKQAPNWKSVDIIDEFTVKISFSKWQNTMLSGFGQYMISKAAFDKNGLDFVRMNPVGTGPFMFVSYAKDTNFIVKKNPGYWKKAANGDQLPYLDGVEMEFITDTVTQTSAMQAGEADMLTVKPGKVAADMAAAGLTVKSAEIDTSVLIGDTANSESPWANEQVRIAIDYCIDREAISKGMGYGYTKPAYQIPGSSDTTYDPNFTLGRKYDPAKAKELLAAAGYPNGFKTSIIACPFSLNRDAAVAVQGYLAKIGIQADVQYPDAGKFTTDYMLGKWNNAAVYEPIAGFPNYMNIFSILFNPITNWHASWQRTPEWLAAYNAALAAPMPDVQLMRNVTNIMTEHALMIPINEGGRGWAYKSYVMDIGVLETNLPPFLKFEQAWLNK
jgi:peptide/nickel transport system substrate-binding protein